MRALGVLLFYLGVAFLVMAAGAFVVSGLDARSDDPMVRERGEFGRVAAVVAAGAALASLIGGAYLYCRRR
jgi:hypothetical protein